MPTETIKTAKRGTFIATPLSPPFENADGIPYGQACKFRPGDRVMVHGMLDILGIRIVHMTFPGPIGKPEYLLEYTKEEWEQRLQRYADKVKVAKELNAPIPDNGKSLCVYLSLLFSENELVQVAV